jgi:hypothetical protein
MADESDKGKGGNKPAELKPFEIWASELETPDWQVAGVVAQEKYPVGREVTKAAFQAAVSKLLDAPLGSHEAVK